MDIQHIKQIPITDYLQQQGYPPTRVQGVHYWYGSPLRKDNTPSFKVNTERNQWYDFGSGEHGDIIDLVCALHRCTISEAIGFLSGTKQVAHQEFSFGGDRKFSERKLEILSAQPPSNPNLLHYLAARAIPLSIASTYCSEVLFQNMKRTYYAIGFANDALGWEIRNMYSKDTVLLQAVLTDGMTNTLPDVIIELIEHRKESSVFSVFSDKVRTDLVQRQGFIILKLVENTIQCSGNGVQCGIDRQGFGGATFKTTTCVIPQCFVHEDFCGTEICHLSIQKYTEHNRRLPFFILIV
ncbi:hypothetical protein HMPREF1555_00255 [Porphyromonas gingivalis F0570]|uniref:Zinc finger CHC2-type domain-containing protein n=1 Tax=Porphyromonas gingivalis F0570 TaxID=1227271 RepID=A0A0E2LSM3_PORGN|nr:hypothetical protein HMPREF1555_00255 [Porphyromonas gingivalis F0570]